MFPLLRRLLVRKGARIAWACVLIIYILTTFFYNFEIYPIEYFVLSRVCEFFFGIFAAIYLPEIKRWHMCIAVIAVIIWSSFDVPLPQIHKTVIMGISLYIILAYIGMRVPELWHSIFCSISKYSYPAYLLHHVIIEQICSRFDNIKLGLCETVFLFMVCIVILIISTLLFYKIFTEIRNWIYIRRKD